MMIASKYKAIESLRQMLLMDGSKNFVNLVDPEGRTALHFACERGSPEAVKLLMEKGADVDVESGDGDKPVDTASNEGHYEIVEFLESG